MKLGRGRVKTGKGVVNGNGLGQTSMHKEECLLCSGCVCLKERWQPGLLYPEALNCMSQNPGGLL